MIVGCVPVAKLYVCADGSQVLDPSDCTAVETEQPGEEAIVIETESIEEELEEIVTEIEEVISDAAKEILDKFTKVTTLEFSYVESPAVVPEHFYFASAEKIKVKLKTKYSFSSNEYFDTVYLNLMEKTAVAYCENNNRAVCPDSDKEFDVDFNEFVIETPFDWMKKVKSVELTGKEVFLQRKTTKEMSFDIDGQEGTMLVDAFFGLPLKITFGGKNYEFRDVTVNGPKAEDLEHQFNT